MQICERIFCNSLHNEQMLQVVDEDSNAVSPHLTPDAQDSHHSDASVEMVEVDISDPHRGLKKQKLKEQNESEYATDKSEEVPNIPKKVHWINM